MWLIAYWEIVACQVISHVLWSWINQHIALNKQCPPQCVHLQAADSKLTREQSAKWDTAIVSGRNPAGHFLEHH